MGERERERTRESGDVPTGGSDSSSSASTGSGGGSTASTSASLEPRGNQRAVIESRAACTSVDAGAGTGKTTTMLMRIEHCIEAGEIDPDDVLVLTFANEAAASIREAITERLAPDAAAAIDVSTYHSFCYRLVREYAYYLGLSPEFDVVTDGGRRRLVRRLLEETDYGFAESSPEAGSAADLSRSVDRFIQTMSREDVDPETLDERLPEARTLELLGEFVLWLNGEASAELSFDNEAFRWFNRDEHVEAGDEALVDYGTLLTYCREKIAESPAAFREDDVVRDVERYLRVMQACVTNVREALSLEEPTTKQLPRVLFGNEMWGAKTDRIEQTPAGRLEHSLEFLRLARHYADVYADYRATLEREGIVDFDELVRTATELLDDDEVATEITERWEQVYCDEFQDTDETQFSLITRLTAGPERPSLLAIGDKDQAIYGWRGTDREGLDRLAAVYDDHERIDLELNFRSRQEILDLTNRCDYGPQSAKTLREVDRTPGEYRESDPPHRLLKIESDEIDPSTAEQVATTVSRLLNGEFERVPERTLEDVAVIVRTNAQAQAVADELRALQIPHERSGSARGEISPGIRTLLSYLRVLVDPTADAHLRRVLLYRYRLTETDLEQLHAREGSLFDVVTSDDVAAMDLADPDRLERARDHLETLSAWRSVYPLSVFFRRFRERTRLEWFLTADERDRLERVERFVDRYDPETVLGSLTSAFVDALERTLQGSSTAYGRGSRSADRVDVMTVHQAKGLQFDTVLVPYLTDEEWCVESDYARRARYRFLAATLDDAVDSPLLADLATDAVGEAWRVLHVALTRAENHLFVFGSNFDYEGGDGADGTLAASSAEACLPDEIEWSVTGERMDLWETVTASFDRVRETYPETVVDRTEEIAVSRPSPGTITYYARDRAAGTREPHEPLETRAAIEAVHRLGRMVRDETVTAVGDAVAYADGDLEGVDMPTDRAASALTTETVRFPVETLSSATDLPIVMRHSYSSMQTHETCERKHYLDHVVRATTDPGPDPILDPVTDSRPAAEMDSKAETGARSVTAENSRTELEDGTRGGRELEDLEGEGDGNDDLESEGDGVEESLADRLGDEDESDRGVRRPDATTARLVGTVFHDVAEEAFYREFRTREEWYSAASRQLTARSLGEYESRVHACIDRYVAARAPGIDVPIHELETLAVEVPFTLEGIPGVAGDVVGYVDSVRRTPAGDLVVLDYKATARRIDPAEATQLRLYLRACEARFDEPVDRVGYVYVGSAGDGSRVDLLTREELPSWASVRETLEAVDEPSFAETTPGDHCRFCPHRSLGCAPTADTSERGPGLEAEAEVERERTAEREQGTENELEEEEAVGDD